MNADTFIKVKLAEFCIREAVDAGGTDKMLAVAFVLRNRVAAGWHGGNWMRVLETAEESRGATPAPLLQLDLKKGEIKSFMQQIDDVYQGSTEDETGGALYYADLHLITSDWFLEKIARDPENHPRVAVIGLTTFFK